MQVNDIVDIYNSDGEIVGEGYVAKVSKLCSNEFLQYNCEYDHPGRYFICTTEKLSNIGFNFVQCKKGDNSDKFYSKLFVKPENITIMYYSSDEERVKNHFKVKKSFNQIADELIKKLS